MTATLHHLRKLLSGAGRLLPLRQGSLERENVYTYRDATACPVLGRVLFRMNINFEHDADATLIVEALNALPSLLHVLDAAHQVADLYSGPAKYPAVEALAEALRVLDAKTSDV